MKSICHFLALILTVQAAAAADADAGKRIVQLQCAGCHIVVPNARPVVANSPAFEAIARKYGSNLELITIAILNPHRGMNSANATVTRREAEDIAAYICTLPE